MSEYSDTLRSMINNADDEVDSLDDATAQIITQIEELEQQRNGILYGMMDPVAIDLSSYLEVVKVPDEGGVGGYIVFGLDYGEINVTDWIIYDVLDNPVYIYQGTGWDGDTDIIEWVSQWNFCYDYINHEFGVTGTYGLQSRIDQLYDALDLILANKSKIENSKTVFEDFAS